MPRKKITTKSETNSGISVNLKTDVYNLKGEVIGKTSLPGDIFAVKVKPTLIAAAVRVFRANQRAGTHDTKTRSEVIGSTKKIYRQKGTGRARHGAITAPIFIGGGVAHGPHPKDYSLNLPQKMKKLALFGVLTDKLLSGSIKIVRGLEKIELKTKKMSETLTNLKLLDARNKKEKILLVTSGEFENVRLSGRNIRSLTIENAKLLNTLEVLLHKNLLLMEDAVPVLVGHFLSKTQVKADEVKETPTKRVTVLLKKNIAVKKTVVKKKVSVKKTTKSKK